MKVKNIKEYSDIIHSPRHISQKHPPMSIDSRAAQFSPYATLVGHKDVITQNEQIAAQKVNLNHKIKYIPNEEL